MSENHSPRKAALRLSLILLLCGCVFLSSCGRRGGEERGGQPDAGEVTTVEAVTEPPEPDPRTVTVLSAEVSQGDLILVNYDHPFVFPTESEAPQDQGLVSVFINKNDDYKVGGSDLWLMPSAFEALERMSSDFCAETGRNDMIMLSAWRSLEAQKEIFQSRVQSRGEEYARMYVADPGCSEHHTGLAADLSIFTDEGKSLYLSDVTEGEWITSHYDEYGFILRYPEEKYEVTHVAYENWHFRYVGVPHSYYIRQQGLVLEEYISLLSALHDPTVPLVIRHGDRSWSVWSVPASASETTKIVVPGRYTGKVTVSGSNAGFFVVTVEGTGDR